MKYYYLLTRSAILALKPMYCW